MSTHLLLNEKPLMVLPSLAKLLGINAAIAVQQIHWIIEIKHENHDDRTDHKGFTWCKYTLNQWQSKLCWMTTDGIHKMLTKLERDDVIISCKPEAKSKNQTKWYRVNYDGLIRLSTKSISYSVQNESLYSVQNDLYKKDSKDLKKKDFLDIYNSESEKTSPEQKNPAFEDPQIQETPPPTPAPLPPENIGYSDPMGDRFRDAGKRIRQVESWLKDDEFLKYLQPIMKRSDYYKDSTSMGDVRDYVRKAKINTPEKLVFYESLSDRYQDFLEFQQRSPQPMAELPELAVIAPPPDHLRNKFKKVS